MTWMITGRSGDILVAVTRYGNPIIRGICSHSPYIPSDPAGPAMRSDYTRIGQALRRLQTVQTDWRIISAPTAKYELHDSHPDLLKRAESHPGASIVEISCFDDEIEREPALSFYIVLQPSVFDQVHELFSKSIFSPSECEYTISVGFTTFRFPGVESDTPTLDEFLSGRPYFSDEVSVSIRRIRDGDA